MTTSNSQFGSLPPPPSGQKGIDPNQFAHLPPPPKGQVGIHPDEFTAQKSSSSPSNGLGDSILTNNPITRFLDKRGNELANDVLHPPKPMTLEEAKHPTQQQFDETSGLAMGVNPAGLEEGIVGGIKSAFPNLASRLEAPGLAERGANYLKTSAEDLVGKVLRPTTKPNKQLTQQIASQVVKEAPFAFTRKGFLSKVEQKVEQYGQEIGAKFEALPPESKNKLSPILQRITQAQDKLTVEGTKTVPAVNQTEHQALSTFKKELVDLVGNTQEVYTPVLRSYLQSLDSTIAKAGKGFGFNVADKASLGAQKTTANIIRDEMAKTRPDIAKINKAYSFWKKLETLTNATLERQTGQIGGLRKTITGGAGLAAGSFIGDQIGGTPGALIGAVAGGAVTGNLQGIMDSPAFKLISIKVRNKAADLLMSGNTELATRFLARHLTRVKGVQLQAKSGQ